MVHHDRNIGENADAPPRRPIAQLDETAISRIAAGEVVERPASAVKELVENALDAGARRISVEVAEGGKRLIRVTDDGHGIEAAALPLALARHATSKIDGTDLLNISTFGFRGEALASLGAVARLTLTSRSAGATEAAQIHADGGRVQPIRPAALTKGTVVEVRDLFHATPARLKFLRTDRAEAQAIGDTLRRLAMAEPGVSFTLSDCTGDTPRTTFRADAESGALFEALHGRLARILGAEFAENALRIDAEREGIRLTGYAALPTYSRGSAVAQYLFVNGRPVRDKLLFGALRAAYADVLSRDRHPSAALFLDIDPERVDVNVHPAKAEVRFREPGLARGLIVSALRHALAEAGHRASTTVAGATLGALQPEPAAGAPRRYQMDRPTPHALSSAHRAQAPMGFAEAPTARIEPDVPQDDAPEPGRPLGAARAQLHENYIVAQTADGVVIVDQHAAHERLVYEKLKRQAAEAGIAAQALLIPEIVELSEDDCTHLLSHADALRDLGLCIEPFGGTAVAVRETPALLGTVDARALVLDILDELADMGDSQTLGSRIDAVLSRVACHGSIRSGRRMQADEMNALLREMEATPLSGQCNHGRPTYVELKLADIERLFGADMIAFDTLGLDPTDPTHQALVAGTVLLAGLLLFAALRASKAARNAAALGAQIDALRRAQSELSGAQAQTAQLLDARFAGLTSDMGETLSSSATRTAQSLGALQERLAAIDRAQQNIEKLSGDVLGLQDILSNKQARGAFGEIQLHDILTKALPPDVVRWQVTLPNGTRADCVIDLPTPPGPIVIDAKFPLEAYEALRRADTKTERQDAARAFRAAIRGHIRAISDKYLVPGATADSALMFLPSEAVYAELHANYPDLVREGFAARVWTVSPTTCMAVLNTLRAVLKDARMREEAGAIRATLRLLVRDVEHVSERVGKLRAHFAQAQGDLDGIATAADRAGRRADRLERIEFDDAAETETPEKRDIRIFRS